MNADALHEGDDSDMYDVAQHGEPVASLVYQSDHGHNMELPIYAGKELCIGRLDDGKCSFFIPDSRVSKRHFRIYSVIYDKEKCDEFQPLIYCEDLESTNGTYVNDRCIGMIGFERIGHLLTHGDIIEIKPDWRFRFQHHSDTSMPQCMTQLQDQEHFADKYAISDRVLGQGQYGAVYLGTEVGTSKQLACKVINLSEAADNLAEHSSAVAGKAWHERVERAREGIRLVMREIKILSKLSHPNIVDLKKTFCSNTHLYIFTELAPGGDLFSYIDKHDDKLSDLQSRVISRQIVLAIQYIHSQGIAHRDIKPENVLIMQTDFGGRVVLTDFGFANYIHKSSGRLMSKLGTSGFIAPEVDSVDVVKGGYTTAADLWSLGVLTACLLTGYSIIPREEFTQISQNEIADRFLGAHDDFTRERWQSMSGRASHFLRNLLAMDPEKRMTADQALAHSWFTKPPTEAALIEEGYKRVIRFWRKRDEDEEVMEDLPGRTPISYANESTTTGPRFRRKLPDASSSPYFGLDRHINQKIASKRKNVLAEVNNSGARFLTSDSYRNMPNRRGVNISAQRDKQVNVEIVDGRDMFGSFSNGLSNGSQQFDMDEISLVPTKPVPRLEETIEFSMGDSVIPETPQPEAMIETQDESPPTRVRVESENDEERSMHDEVAKTIPKYSSAKVLKDELMKKRLEKEMARLRRKHSSVPSS
ncbi:related to myosin light chain kinase 2 [Phialocephala subalpina]|uniref:Related to myosin light chain kinase 2 n=1 Tax=Phialocephala subalpina TaxID=576137 RepID=A0A1L7X2B2_9HELO|nr:related to myosin light chain kinase 2 [Phialocephala subalpina]